jgi:hypothetical protein
MKTLPRGSFRLLVLIPHRDSRLLLRGWSAALFSAGFSGAWSFPWAAPLAALSRPLSEAELKHCALVLREETLAGGKDGKIKTGPAAGIAFPGGDAAVFGPVLELAVPDRALSAAAAKIAARFSPLVLGAALVRSGETPALPVPPPDVSFRAAALANMICRPLSADCYSLEWKIGKPCWLPPVKKRDKGRG